MIFLIRIIDIILILINDVVNDIDINNIDEFIDDAWIYWYEVGWWYSFVVIMNMKIASWLQTVKIKINKWKSKWKIR